MSSRIEALQRPSFPGMPREPKSWLPRSESNIGRAKAALASSWISSLFAVKTTISGLLALLIAFEFNLDQPKWALLTVFIVAQPQSGLVIAKSFYRIIGTVVGAAGALVLVSLFAQERVLFLGTLALWIAFCTYASKHARNFASYGFVLSGYTAAIVGVTSALDPGNTFFIAVARVTEISIGLITTTVISHLVLPTSVADSLRRSLVTTRTDISNYAAALLRGSESALRRTKLLRQVIAMETLRSSAVFEDHEIRKRSDALRRIEVAILRAAQVGGLLDQSLIQQRHGNEIADPRLRAAISQAQGAIVRWGRGEMGSTILRASLIRASVDLPLARELYRDASVTDSSVIQGGTAIARVYDFFDSFATVAEAYDGSTPAGPEPGTKTHFAASNDRFDAIWAGLRAGLALLLVSGFWILSAWPSGSTAAILASVATARLATMERPLAVATGGTLVIALATIPSFLLVEVLLPHASGFAMFAVAVSPPLFLFAYLMALPRTAGIGFIAALYFANVSGFQNRMTYDAVAFLNTSIALTLAVATAALLFAIIAPDTPRVARARFLRAARHTFERTGQRWPHIDLAEFETTMVDSLDQLCRSIPAGAKQGQVTIDAAIAVMGAGRELVKVRENGRSVAAAAEVKESVRRVLADPQRLQLNSACSSARSAAIACLSALREDEHDVAKVRAAARDMVAFATIQEELQRSAMILLEDRKLGGPNYVA